MHLEVVKEHEDGSCTVNIDMTPEEHTLLINYAFIELLKKGIEEGKKYTPKDDDEQSLPNLGNTEY